MKKLYTSDRLIMKISDKCNADAALAFYSEGQAVFDAVESVKPPAFYTLHFQKYSLEQEYEAYLSGVYARYFVYANDEPDIIIGTVSFSHITRGVYNSCITGYKFLPRFQNRGYAHEALLTLVKAVFGDLGLHRIEAFVLPNNLRSINLLEKLGFEPEGTAKSVIRLKDGYTDHLRYALINVQTPVPVTELT